MSSKVKVLILRTAGTNCDQEMAQAFRECGAQADLVHINKLYNKEASMHDYHILAIPGGFTYGDDIESGRILANELRLHLNKDINKFISEGKLIIGICNGFQVLVRAHILPGNLNGSASSKQAATLTNNDSGKFEDRWSHLKVNEKSVWTKGLGKQVYFPVAHAEGKFLTDPKTLSAIKSNGQIAFQYCTQDGAAPKYPDNPNGSIDHIAGITDKTGRILGLMPHPERHFFYNHHPRWTRLKKRSALGDGAKIFQNGVDYARKKFL